MEKYSRQTGRENWKCCRGWIDIQWMVNKIFLQGLIFSDLQFAILILFSLKKKWSSQGQTLWGILMKLYSNCFFLCLLTRRKNGYRYFHNIVLTEIKIHNMHCSLAFPLDSIRKLLCGNVKDTLTSATQHHSASLSCCTLSRKISSKEALNIKRQKEKVQWNLKAELNGWKWVGVKLLNFFHFLCSKIKTKKSAKVS